MAKWMIAAKKADFEAMAEKFHISPITARLLRNRDLVEEGEIQTFLHGTLKDLHNPRLMEDMEKAAVILSEKIKEGAFIRVIGDYDVDGICAAYILQKGILHLGGKADRVIPHRRKDGYGLNDKLIENACQDGVDTIVTCDNGIAASPQIEQAKKLHMTVVVTDHHEVPYEDMDGERRYLLPKADAVVDPKRPDCNYPYPQICGAVVAYKLICLLFEMANRKDKDVLEELLCFGALATVCDVMELRDENRIIVKEGLSLMARTSNLGLKALIMVNGLQEKTLTPYHAGFILGPCMNAAGRIDTADRALELFFSTEWKEAVTIASDLKSMNESRKQMTEEGIRKAIRQIEETSLQNDRVLVVYLPECHESLAGLIAGKIREKYGKPAFVLTKAEEGIKGSGRSIETYSMYEEMTACKELFTRYGGHKMAAGLSLAGEEMVEKLRRTLNENCHLTDEDFEEMIHIDIPMPLRFANREFLQEISCLEPFGVGNQRPLFARKGISLLCGRKIGKNKNVGKYRIADEEGYLYEMIYFGDLETFDQFLEKQFGKEVFEKLYGRGLGEKEAVITMAYYPELNFYAGKESIQIVMQYYDVVR